MSSEAGTPRGVPARIAAIDIGTVTTRLLVAEVDANRLHELVRRSRITHLGEGLAASGQLSEAAIARVADTVREYVAEARRLDAERTVALATSAARDASNAESFMRVLEGAGVVPQTISGSREAQLSFLGATLEIDDGGILVVDPGGGSTELTLGRAEGEGTRRRVEVEASRSIDVGARRLTEMHLASDPPSRAELERAREWATGEFRPFYDGLRAKPRRAITLAGTATSLSAIKQGLAHYDSSLVHGSVLSGADLSELLEELASMTLERRRSVVGLEPERAEVIVAGTLIMETVLGLAGLDSTTVSEHDILYGIVLDDYWSRGEASVG